MEKKIKKAFKKKTLKKIAETLVIMIVTMICCEIIKLKLHSTLPQEIEELVKDDKYMNSKDIKVDEKNVFDEMYNSRVKESTSKDYSRGMFQNMKQLKIERNTAERSNIFYGSFDENYKKECLEPNTSLFIDVDRENRYIYFSYKIKFLDDNGKELKNDISLKYIYYIDKKVLLKRNVDLYISSYDKDYKLGKHNAKIEKFLEDKNLTMEDLDKKQEYFLKDIFLKDYFEANSDTSKYSLDNLGDYKEVTEKIDNFKNGPVDKDEELKADK